MREPPDAAFKQAGGPPYPGDREALSSRREGPMFRGLSRYGHGGTYRARSFSIWDFVGILALAVAFGLSTALIFFSG
ncbi:hypothetical protein AA13595_0739 [Gluconacetobacter johannae DSM 13595]|nr:hypothetical protein AA13595_0739 [Gluconacetobacter johannae DSM 13595]